jgi:rubrerythrin
MDSTLPVSRSACDASPMNTEMGKENDQTKNPPEPNQLIDKIGERIVYEKMVIQLYEKLLDKHRDSTSEELPPYELLKQFHREEIEHYRLLSDVMESLGGDPRTITPSGTMENVAVNGWPKVLDDPHSTFDQCLHIIHLAELGDNDSWELLVELAELSDMKDIAEEFRSCLAQEEGHLLNVRNWMRAHLRPDESH